MIRRKADNSVAWALMIFGLALFIWAGSDLFTNPDRTPMRNMYMHPYAYGFGTACVVIGSWLTSRSSV